MEICIYTIHISTYTDCAVLCCLLGFPDSSVGKESACNAGDPSLIPGLGRSPGEGKRYPLQYSGLENSMDCIVHGVAKSQTRLSDFHFHFTNPKWIWIFFIWRLYLSSWIICSYISPIPILLLVFYSDYLYFWGLPGGAKVTNLPTNVVAARDANSIPGSGRSPWVGNANLFQYSCLENSMDRGAWQIHSTGSQRVGHDWACTHIFLAKLLGYGAKWSL